MNPWSLTYEGFDPGHEGLREALCTLGNGRFATRGAAPEAEAGAVHYPGTYVAGCYDRLTSDIAGHRLTNEDMVNLPNWLPLTFATPGCPWFSPGTADLLGYRQDLDMRHAVLHRLIRFRDAEGRVTSVRQRRLVSMADPYLAALETTFTAENWSGPLRVRSGLDGRVANTGVARYRDLRGDHLTGHATGIREPLTWLRARTRSSGIEVALASRVDVSSGGGGGPEAERHDDHVLETRVLPLDRGHAVAVVKTVALTTSRDLAVSDATSAALRRAGLAPGFGELLEQHEIAWRDLWERARLEVTGPNTQRDIRLSTFHVLQTLSPHTADLDVGVPARGLHGEAYRGHVFWDELFVLPWLTLRFPETARGALRYRLRRLPEARAAARAAGLRGAMFPWQSGSDGRDETQRFHLNPRSGQWTPDHTHLQRHVGLAVAYNAWQHYAITGDVEFLAGTGAHLLVEIARFFASVARLDPLSGRYEIKGVMGPDEYQADVLMLFYLLTAREVRQILDRLGYPAAPGLTRRTIRYYLSRTCHGSTLSAVVHAWVLARSDRTGSWRFFTETLTGDITDVQGGTTAEGVHLGAMAGTLDLVQRCYLDLEARPDGLHLNPVLPEQLTTLSLCLRYRGAELVVDADPARVRIARADDGPTALDLVVHGHHARLRRGDSRTFPLPEPKRDG
ncbi:glycoside hydrolase family 65 protein [Microbispora triticiradicis]|uniref:Glycoside hydrolase family 65 protein n=2 Tax=Microbispora TaxID=2005 RepID=A0ABY3M5D8_9ACTN|nr:MULTISPECIES: glycosyl hydrolase family 65 protein [Microbispora]TLP66626.1 glycoside hydrolase family 65 protein [Microbispora fusca]TYB67558.1 glycoside hydrolase family 65 protein [Microbispora tritici]